MTATRRRGEARILGLGALACIACCAGPVLAFLGGLSIVGLASTTLIGGAGLVIAGAASVAYLVVWRRRSSSCAITDDEPVSVAAPARQAEGR